MEELTWTERREASFLNVLEASWPLPRMIQQQGVCNSSLVLHRSLNLLVSFAVLWQKLQSLQCVPLRKLCQVLAETTQIIKSIERSRFAIDAPVVD